MDAASTDTGAEPSEGDIGDDSTEGFETSLSDSTSTSGTGSASDESFDATSSTEAVESEDGEISPHVLCEFPDAPNAFVEGYSPLGEIEAGWGFLRLFGGECGGWVFVFTSDPTELKRAYEAGETRHTLESSLGFSVYMSDGEWKGAVQHIEPEKSTDLFRELSLDVIPGEDRFVDPWSGYFEVHAEGWNLRASVEKTARCEMLDIYCP